MGLIELWQKFKEVKTWLAGPGADALEKAIEINDKITDAMRSVKDYLQSLESQGGLGMASMSVEDVNALEGLRKEKEELEAMVNAPGARFIPGLREVLTLLAVEAIKHLLDRFGPAVKTAPTV